MRFNQRVRVRGVVDGRALVPADQLDGRAIVPADQWTNKTGRAAGFTTKSVGLHVEPHVLVLFDDPKLRPAYLPRKRVEEIREKVSVRARNRLRQIAAKL